MRNLLMLSMLATVALTGCASISENTSTSGCQLQDFSGCSSMQDIYAATQKADAKKLTKVQNVFDIRAYNLDALNESAAGVKGRGDQPVVGTLSNYPASDGTGGAPVFKQPKVMRVFTKPYVDADGNLRSGEQVYFSTPGEWSYGTLNKSGSAAAGMAASGMFEPANDRNIGFNPVESKRATTTVNQTQPSGVVGPVLAPSSSATPPAPVQAAAQAAAPTATPTATPTTTAQQGQAPLVQNTQTGITQPYQRLTDSQ